MRLACADAHIRPLVSQDVGTLKYVRKIVGQDEMLLVTEKLISASIYLLFLHFFSNVF